MSSIAANADLLTYTFTPSNGEAAITFKRHNYRYGDPIWFPTQPRISNEPLVGGGRFIDTVPGGKATLSMEATFASKADRDKMYTWSEHGIVGTLSKPDGRSHVCAIGPLTPNLLMANIHAAGFTFE